MTEVSPARKDDGGNPGLIGLAERSEAARANRHDQAHEAGLGKVIPGGCA